MAIIVFVVFNASIFSFDGIGEDVSVFRMPFTEVYQKTNIAFALNPEFHILTEEGNFRGIFWTNPFHFSLTVPITKGFIFAAGNYERLNQSFDIYFEEGELKMHVFGDGGIEEVYVNMGKNFGGGEVALRGSYLFGNSWEVWNYTVGDFDLVDSFLYKYHGKIFCGGLRYNLFSLSYEFLGDLTMEKAYADTTIDLPERLSLGLTPRLFGGTMNFLYEHSFWGENNPGYISPHRFKIGFTKRNLSIHYIFNPWYLSEVKEHGIIFSVTTPIRNVGSIMLSLNGFLRMKGSLKEIKIVPQLKLVLAEIFSPRRK